jgi:broad specificity phosphatase PhoE
MIFYGMRHGLTDMNKRGIINGETDEPLATEGIARAMAAAQSIPSSVRHIYSSPKLRTVQTATILANQLVLPLTLMDGLAEIRWAL